MARSLGAYRPQTSAVATTRRYTRRSWLSYPSDPPWPRTLVRPSYSISIARDRPRCRVLRSEDEKKTIDGNGSSAEIDRRTDKSGTTHRSRIRGPFGPRRTRHIRILGVRRIDITEEHRAEGDSPATSCRRSIPLISIESRDGRTLVRPVKKKHRRPAPPMLFSKRLITKRAE